MFIYLSMVQPVNFHPTGLNTRQLQKQKYYQLCYCCLWVIVNVRQNKLTTEDDSFGVKFHLNRLWSVHVLLYNLTMFIPPQSCTSNEPPGSTLLQ